MFSGALVVFAGLGYLGWIVRRTAAAYSVQKAGRGWVGRLYEADPDLGFRLVPGARASEVFPVGPEVPLATDADGFRVPLDAGIARPARPHVLALGCSYTFGAGCAAEDAYPELVARRLGGSCSNAGVPSYGLAQMVILARRLIPVRRPDYVLFQHSPWLIVRSQRGFAQSYLGSVPTPSFGPGSGEVAIRPPAFAPIVFDLPADRYLRSSSGALDFLSFQLRVGLPLFVHDDLHRGLLRRERGSPAGLAGEDVVARAHAEIAALCAQHGAKMVLVAIGSDCQRAEIEDGLGQLGVVVVDATAALCSRLPDTHWRNYFDRYARWGGDPPVLVDPHPNPAAHAVVAEAIVEALERAR